MPLNSMSLYVTLLNDKVIKNQVLKNCFLINYQFLYYFQEQTRTLGPAQGVIDSQLHRATLRVHFSEFKRGPRCDHPCSDVCEFEIKQLF